MKTEVVDEIGCFVVFTVFLVLVFLFITNVLNKKDYTNCIHEGMPVEVCQNYIR